VIEVEAGASSPADVPAINSAVADFVSAFWLHTHAL
jgi:hypothetical protein